MCGRFTETAAFDVLAERFGITVEDSDLEDLAPRYNVSPSQTVPIISASDRVRRLIMAKWGFLDPDDEALWLEQGPIAPVKVLQCLRPLPSARMEAYPVSTLVSSPGHEGAQLVEPVPA